MKKLITFSLITISFLLNAQTGSIDPCADLDNQSDSWYVSINLNRQMHNNDFLTLLDSISAPGFTFDGLEHLGPDPKLEPGRIIYFSFDRNKLNWPDQDVKKLKIAVLKNIKNIPGASLKCSIKY